MLLLIVAFSLPACYGQTDNLLAFPGAEGAGKYTSGGRGGKVIKVTNLNDSGPGSLREAIKAKGPRTIVFEVSGNIELKSQLNINNGDLTIAGQTAPGDGICLKGHELRINADNIIVRFMRFRPGDIGNAEYDAITGMRHKNIIIDHCSMSWSTDETVSFYDNENVTLQWSILSESLNNSVHSKGAHGYGGIWGGKNASFIYNVLAHHSSRNPRLQGTRYSPVEGMEKIEIVNNLIYNWGQKAIYGGENGLYNLIGNVFIPGPATERSAREEILEPYAPYGQYFLQDNIFLHEDGQPTEAGWNHVSLNEKDKEAATAEEAFVIVNKARVLDPEMAYRLMLEYAGANLFRDPVDTRIIEEIRERKSNFGNHGIIDSQDEAGGWPLLRPADPPIDSDGDGMPDEWEIRNGLNPNDPADGNLFTLDKKYTNLEVYLNEIISHTFPQMED
ncbi:MAG: pectate lyase [Bacteroidales bacterium]|nr:pectate lyase [Bacteroidales bacterium]